MGRDGYVGWEQGIGYMLWRVSERNIFWPVVASVKLSSWL